MRTDDFLPENTLRTAFFTGHRILSPDERQHLPVLVSDCVKEAYDAGYRRFFCGCALGFDTLAALETVRFRRLHPDVVLSLAIPCLSQADRWPEKDRIVWRELRSLADDQIVLSPLYYQGVMLTRNRYMADRSSLCICWLTRWQGGTASAVRYALTRDRMKIINLAAVRDSSAGLMREESWNYTYISPSAGKNADIAPLRLSSRKLLIMKYMQI